MITTNIIAAPAVTPIQIPTPISLGDAFKPKRAGTKTSHILFVLDDSGSMQDCRDATIEGFNGYLASQKENEEKTGIKTFVSLYKFDGRSVTPVYTRQEVTTIPNLTRDSYNPQGMTNLYDGIGGVMLQVNKDLTATKKAERDSIIINILTDGLENSSRTFKQSDIKQMVSKAEDKAWTFMFLGANIDAFAAGNSMGFGSHNTMQFDTRNIGETFRSASRMSNDIKGLYASGYSGTTGALYAATSFTDAERTSAVKKDDTV
jgi:hypothetical protein